MSWLANLEKFHQEIIRSTNHDVPEPGFIADWIPETETIRFHSRNQRVKVLRFNSKMMNRASSRRFRGLVIDLEERIPKCQSYIPHSRGLFVPYNAGTEHRAEELDGSR